MVVHEAVRDFGVGAGIAARIADQGIWYLDAPILRVAAEPVPAPYSLLLEAEWLPGTESVMAAARKLVTA
jgi:2-oxoisovalerate dehydrogenase E1 component